MHPDPFDLQRFVKAQESAYAAAFAELRTGRKRGHWIWFVFPQLKGLGWSSTSQHYGIKDLAEARAYHEHPVLGPRLTECTEAVLAVEGGTANGIFGHPDDLKFRSCMTLFHQACPETAAFGRALERFYSGEPDPITLKLLGNQDKYSRE